MIWILPPYTRYSDWSHLFLYCSNVFLFFIIYQIMNERTQFVKQWRKRKRIVRQHTNINAIIFAEINKFLEVLMIVIRWHSFVRPFEVIWWIEVVTYRNCYNYDKSKCMASQIIMLLWDLYCILNTQISSYKIHHWSFVFILQSNDILSAILEGYPKTKKQLYVSINTLWTDIKVQCIITSNLQMGINVYFIF